MNSPLLTSLILAASLFSTAAELPVLSYEKPVTLRGTLREEFDKSFVENGAPPPLNKPVRHWILRLDQPVTVHGKPNDALYVSEANVTEIDLAASEIPLPEKIDPRTRYVLTGTLSHAHPVHHLRSVLMKATKLELEKK